MEIGKSYELRGCTNRLMNFRLKYVIGILTFLVLCFVFKWRAGQVSGAETLVWYSIIPPLLAVTLAIVTARLFPSLCIAVGVGLVLSWYQKGATPSNLLAEIVWFIRAVSIGNNGIDLFNFWVVLFVFLIMAMVSVVIASGGINGVVVWLSQFAKGSAFIAIYYRFDGDNYLYWRLFQCHACWTYDASADRSSSR